MTSRTARTKTEITEKEFIELLAANPGYEQDGVRYVVAVKMRGLIWRKPLGYTKGGKFFRFDD